MFFGGIALYSTQDYCDNDHLVVNKLLVEICRRLSSNNNNNTWRAVKLRVRDRRSQDIAISYRKWRYDDCDDETKVIFCLPLGGLGIRRTGNIERQLLSHVAD
jgi:hypothetical protein